MAVVSTAFAAANAAAENLAESRRVARQHTFIRGRLSRA
jgi:hypothetical protein